MRLNEDFGVAPAKLEDLKARIVRLKIDLDAVDESFSRGGGKGGQKVNKTSNRVQLSYPPLDLRVACQRERKRSLNRFLALRELVDQIEMKLSPETSERMAERRRVQKRKARSSARSALKLMPLLLLSLALPGRAQEHHDTAAGLAAEAKSSPTTPQNMRDRLDRTLEFAQSSGNPGRYVRREMVMQVRMLIRGGRLPEAAALVGRIMRSLESASAGEMEGPPGMGPGRGRPPPDGEVHGDQVPMMLSQPQAAPPVERAAEAPRVRPFNPFLPVPPEKKASAPAEPPKDGGPPWPLIIAVASLLPALAFWWLRRKAEPTAAAPAAPAVAAPRTEPRLADKYSVGGLISRGGMGEVYEGQDLKLGRRVAIKRMLPDIKLDADLRRQFLQEARTVAKLTHPYIVQIHDCFEEGEDVYLVFEYVKGRTLAQVLIEKPRLSLKEWAEVFAHVCPAVEHAHKNHILHRDLKPANIMIDDNGIARVMDFGIALESTRTIRSAGPGFLDASGTLRYMPPEQHHGKSVRASDIYAMGVCLYEMTTGTLPFAADDVEDLIARKRARGFPAPSALVPALPKELDLFVTSVLAPDPKDRMGSALEFLELLEEIAR